MKKLSSMAMLSVFLTSIAWVGSVQATLVVGSEECTVPMGASGVAAGMLSQVTASGLATPADSCNARITNPVNDTLGSDPSNFAVNTLSIGGMSDWEFIAKDDSGGPLTVRGVNTDNGSWSVDAGTLDGATDFLIVLKDGNQGWGGWMFNNVQDSSTVGGFADVMGGNWSMAPAFVNNGNPKDLSHLTLYAKGDVPISAVPAPATVLLFGSGLVGLGLWRWKTVKTA